LAFLDDGGALYVSRAATILASTLSGNVAITSGGAIISSGALRVAASALAGDSCAGAITDGGDNLEYLSTTRGFTTTAPFFDQLSDPRGRPRCSCPRPTWRS